MLLRTVCMEIFFFLLASAALFNEKICQSGAKIIFPTPLADPNLFFEYKMYGSRIC
jgi:hypothetical protein